MTDFNSDYAQLAAWKDYRIAQQQVCQWRVMICCQVQKNHQQRHEVVVTALSAEDAQRIAKQRYLKMYPRRVNSTWVESVERVTE